MDLNEKFIINEKIIKEYLNFLFVEEREEVKEFVGYERKFI